MKRFGQVVKLKKDRIEEYTKLHEKVWTEVREIISKSNIKNYSIYLKDDYLFAYFEYVGEDFEADMKQIATAPITQKWWDVCKPCMIPIETRSEGEWWANMEEVFHLE